MALTGWEELGLATMGLGAGMDFLGTLQAGAEEAASLKRTAALARLEGGEARTLTKYKVRLIHEAGAEGLSAMQAETGKSGLAMTGTPLLGLVHSARQVELAAAIEGRAGKVTRSRYEMQAAQLEEDARRAKKAAKRKAIGGLIGGAAKIATTAAMFAA